MEWLVAYDAPGGMAVNPERLILEGEYGSRAHGTDTPDSDTDMMGVFIENAEYVTGILNMDTQESKTAIRGERSTHLDVDGVYYPLRKWAGLAAKGNPTVLTLLFLPEYKIVNPAGEYILQNRDMFLSKSAGSAFLGYMMSQREGLLGTRNKKTNRPELIHKFGYDTKFGAHMIRLAIEGIQLMRTGFIQLPLPENNRQYILDIRYGKISKEEVLKKSNALENSLRENIKNSKLPERANVQGINEMLHEIYLTEWRQA